MSLLNEPQTRLDTKQNVLFVSVIVLHRNNTQSSLYVAASARRKSGTATLDKRARSVLI